MLTLNTSGKTSNEALDLVRTISDDESDVKILIDGPVQAESIRKILESKGFNSIVPEDDDGILYLMAAKLPDDPKPERERERDNSATGILITYEAGKYRPAFMKKFLASLLEVKHKPDVIALMNSAVNLAAYNSPTCDTLKRLEAEGVQILISSSCADRLGITEAIGAGVIAEMSEIMDEIYSCGKVVSI